MRQTVDHVGRTEQGDWIEVHTDIQEVGRSTAFTKRYFHVGTKRIVRASAVPFRTSHPWHTIQNEWEKSSI